ncbi:MAG: T9SS type A sorting domain-containing protein, partial [Gammaproteobacteria bacterium]|nr:T9SS type A sorting domain-containing protein [Gammaproteobacteria bacterium]
LEMSESTVLTGGVGVLDGEEVTIQSNTDITTFLRSSNAYIDGSSTVADYISSDSPIMLPPFINNPYFNNNNVSVPSGGSMTLSGSNYGDVIVGKNATLIIDNGEIYLRSLNVNTSVTIIFNQSTNMMVQRKLKIGMVCNVNVGGPSTVIYVGDNASVRQGSTVEANIYSLEELEVNDPGSFLTTYMNGLFIGNDGVSSDDNVIWGWNLNCDGLPGNMPFASPNLEGTIEGISPKEASLRIYPNPVKALLNIEINLPTEKPATVEILDISGRLLYSTKHDFESPKWQIDLSPMNLASGLYLLNIRTDDGV